jgi:predicted alpha/beta superfamily hydrolase
MHTLTCLGVALTLALGAICSLAAPAHAKDMFGNPTIRVIVIDKSELDANGNVPFLKMAHSANNWNPGLGFEGEPFKNPDGSRGWVFEVDIRAASKPDFAFKFCRGTWDTVEVDDQGRDIGNRTLPPGTEFKEGTEVRLELLGFVDQRGTRFPAAPPSAFEPTIVGTVEVFTMASKKVGERTIRVWMPPNYAMGKAKGLRYPIMYFCDGQNMFSRADNQFGVEWQADEAATDLIGKKKIPPMLIVGIDHSGVNRSVDYHPPGTSFQDKASAGDVYLKFVIDELMPEIKRRYAVKTGPESTGLGGSSFGGNAALYGAMHRPDVFSRVLIESPALFIGDGVLVTSAAKSTTWPSRIFLAVGDRELGEPDRDAEYVDRVKELEAALHASGLSPERLRVVIEPGGRHHEDTWAKRLPDALTFLWRAGAPGSR